MKFIFVLVVSFLITKCLSDSYNILKHGTTEVKYITFKVTAKDGIVGCLSKEKFAEATKYYDENNNDAIRKMIDDKICFLFRNGEELKAPEDTCFEAADNDLFPFSSEKILLLKPYVPCFAIR